MLLFGDLNWRVFTEDWFFAFKFSSDFQLLERVLVFGLSLETLCTSRKYFWTKIRSTLERLLTAEFCHKIQEPQLFSHEMPVSAVILLPITGNFPLFSSAYAPLLKKRFGQRFGLGSNQPTLKTLWKFSLAQETLPEKTPCESRKQTRKIDIPKRKSKKTISRSDHSVEMDFLKNL